MFLISFFFVQRNERSYAEWHKVKEEVKHEDQQLLKDKVALQHDLIESRDQLYQLHHAAVEQRERQVNREVIRVNMRGGSEINVY